MAAVFVAVSHWMHRASAKQKMAACLEETACKLAQCIRFPMLSNDFLHFVASQVMRLWHLHCQHTPVRRKSLSTVSTFWLSHNYC